MTDYPLHLPIAHIDVQRICHNFSLLKELSKNAQAKDNSPIAMATLPDYFGKNHAQGFIWPSQLAVVKADAYGHGHIEVAKALIKHGAEMFASGSVQECAALRKHISNDKAILSLLGPVHQDDIHLCIKLGIIPVIHHMMQIELLSHIKTTLPIAIKCNSGMSRLGFEQEELWQLIEKIKQLPHIIPVVAMSHLHSADTLQVQEEISKQGSCFATMLKILRDAWPNLAASLANSAGTIFADSVTAHIGAHICRPGIALYGCNPYYNNELAVKAKDLLPAMWVSTPILSTRKLKQGQGIGYGHTFIAKKDLDVAILACGYADGFSRSLSNKGIVNIAHNKVPLIGRVSMQMLAVDISDIDTKSPNNAWILGGPNSQNISAEEIAQNWGTITYEVLCALGNNVRKYINFNQLS